MARNSPKITHLLGRSARIRSSVFRACCSHPLNREVDWIYLKVQLYFLISVYIKPWKGPEEVDINGSPALPQEIFLSKGREEERKKNAKCTLYPGNSSCNPPLMQSVPSRLFLHIYERLSHYSITPASQEQQPEKPSLKLHFYLCKWLVQLQKLAH